MQILILHRQVLLTNQYYSNNREHISDIYLATNNEHYTIFSNHVT